MPYSWHNPRKFSVPSALSANSLLWSIGSLFFHGIYRLFYSGSAFSSVTYLLNLWCYLCPEPAPWWLGAGGWGLGRLQVAQRIGDRDHSDLTNTGSHDPEAARFHGTSGVAGRAISC